jgi:hypothetical protein
MGEGFQMNKIYRTASKKREFLHQIYMETQSISSFEAQWNTAL